MKQSASQNKFSFQFSEDPSDLCCENIHSANILHDIAQFYLMMYTVIGDVLVSQIHIYWDQLNFYTPVS